MIEKANKLCKDLQNVLLPPSTIEKDGGDFLKQKEDNLGVGGELKNLKMRTGIKGLELMLKIIVGVAVVSFKGYKTLVLRQHQVPSTLIDETTLTRLPPSAAERHRRSPLSFQVHPCRHLAVLKFYFLLQTTSCFHKSLQMCYF
ncbi:hypothetical protein L6452_21703 [Arctium lappa]|uniref:Uncharacterized protein n=1 Tax=Arctium lappa TaxID=4217 RepID=A0ACB9AYL4_ARCLA|nr:hypothetical protein L6452_21703 [Arctium lappa]